MESIYFELTKHMTISPGATSDEIQGFRKCIPYRIPSDYLGFLKFSNGAEGEIGSHYLVIWSIQDVISLNQAYSVEKYAPRCMLFGSDGGNEGYGFDYRIKSPIIVNLPFIDMDWSNAITKGNDFLDFLQSLL